jgi:hypothetical protein
MKQLIKVVERQEGNVKDSTGMVGKGVEKLGNKNLVEKEKLEKKREKLENAKNHSNYNQ